MAKIGIGIVTFKRLEYLQRVVAAVREHTKSEYELVVAEDGGEDGTAEWCRENNVRVVTGTNAGVCWNKNRALFALQELGCDPILLLEDDCLPVVANWDWQWRIATSLHGHLAYAHPKLKPWQISGTGTFWDPVVNNKATAQCSSVSGLALSEVGFFDTRFKGYGVGHAEWTTRLKKLGYGFKKAIDAEGREVKANLYIDGGLVGDDAPTFKDKDNIARNEKLFEELKKEEPYRHPWANEEERTRFLAEMSAAGISSARYNALTAEEPVPGLNARHLRPYGKAFRRAFTEQRSFLKSSGWLSSMALSIPAVEGELAPWFNFTVIHLLRDRVKPDWSVFEFGSGYSTLWWATKVKNIWSVETDEAWVGLISGLAPKNATVRFNPANETFADTIKAAKRKKFEVIVVDGHDRPRCLINSLSHLAADGVVILDNSNREEYREALDQVKAKGFSELRLKGPAPMTYQEETTSFLYRSNNVFGF